jgi:hypothetical protein
MSGTATVRSVLGGLEWRLTLETSRSPPVNSSDPERKASIDFVARCVHSPGCPMTTGPSCMQVYDETDETADIGCSLSVLPASATATDDALSRWRANADSSGDQPLEALSALHGSEALGTVFANGAAGGVLEFPQLGTPPGPAPAARGRERTLARRRLMRGRGGGSVGERAGEGARALLLPPPQRWGPASPPRPPRQRARTALRPEASGASKVPLEGLLPRGWWNISVAIHAQGAGDGSAAELPRLAQSVGIRADASARDPLDRAWPRVPASGLLGRALQSAPVSPEARARPPTRPPLARVSGGATRRPRAAGHRRGGTSGRGSCRRSSW